MDRWIALGFPFDDFTKELARDVKPELKIEVVSAKTDATGFIITASINHKGLKNRKAFLSLVDAKTKLSLGGLSITLEKESFSKQFIISKFNFLSIAESGELILICDEIEAKTKSFSLIERDQKKVAETSKGCLCKKVLGAEDLSIIVTTLRKSDNAQPINDRNKKTKAKRYLDKDGNILESTDRGKKPDNAVREYTKIQTFYDELAGDKKPNEDRLFIMSSNGLNVKAENRNYSQFSKYLEAIFTTYHIDNCLRRTHFFAQIYVETIQLRTTYEISPSSKVSGGDFYRGRGLLQLTHDYNYLEYYSEKEKKSFFKDFLSKRENNTETVSAFNERTNNQYMTAEDITSFDEYVKSISTDFLRACDSAGWYWNKQKVNTYADKDDIYSVSASVNNVSAKGEKNEDLINDYDKRVRYCELLKDIFDDENCK